ncbi:hypothetical protein [Saccharopolyspora rhizosphaerae]|nr:hypothetical protein [Saccharopolyspora rhizosphaerae]
MFSRPLLGYGADDESPSLPAHPKGELWWLHQAHLSTTRADR